MNLLNRLTILACAALLPALALADCTIFVSHAEDATGNPSIANDKMTLREAIEVARGVSRCYTPFEADRIVGGNFVIDNFFCAASLGVGGNRRLAPANPGCGGGQRDTIRFWDAIEGGPTIVLADSIDLDSRDSIDGGPSLPLARSNIALVGNGASHGAISASFSDGTLSSASGSIRNLFILDFAGFGIWANEVTGLQITGTVVGNIRPRADGALGVGILLGAYPDGSLNFFDRVFDARIGGPAASERNVVYNTGFGIVVADGGSDDSSPRNVRIENNIVGLCDEFDTGAGFEGCTGIGTPTAVNYGILIDQVPAVQIIGNTVARAAGPGIEISGVRSRDAVIRGNRIGLARTLDVARPNGSGINVIAGNNHFIGGDLAGEGNLISSNSGSGIHWLAGSVGSGHVIAGNIIGLNPTRTQVRANGGDGIRLEGGSNFTIRGNVISGNGVRGVFLNGVTGVTLENNVIGLRGSANTANDNTAAPNGDHGIALGNAAGNTIGPGNRIAGNDLAGVLIQGDGSDNNVIRGNVIGLSNGNDRRPQDVGVVIEDGADANLVGGTATADRNTLSGHNSEGVRISGTGTSGNRVVGNFIGITPQGNGTARNGANGVRINDGPTATEVVNNVIAGNDGDGVNLAAAGTGSKVQGNTIGLNAANQAAPNGASGIALLAGTTGALIGETGAPNTVAASGNVGVFIANPTTTGNTIQSNVIGSVIAGQGNNNGGITLLDGANANTVSNNVVIGHTDGFGIEIANATGNTLRANRVGVNDAGTVVANLIGVRIAQGATSNILGGTGTQRNLISGNSQVGVLVTGTGTNGNNVQGNYIGTDAAGTSARPNGIGVLVEAGASGGSIFGNVISGNAGDGVRLSGGGANLRVQSNRIGVAPTGTAVLANAGNGIRIVNTNGVFVGGLPPQANVIRGNALAGVHVESGNGNNLEYNQTAGNGGLGIDLGALGVTANDASDADTGANGLLNFPTLSNVVQNGASASMTVSYQGRASTQHGALVYANTACDASAHGEGETAVGSVVLTTNASGSASAQAIVPLPSAAAVGAFTATATTAVAAGEDTSEFSPCATGAPAPDAVFANGFETVAPMLIASAQGKRGGDGFVRLDAGSARLDLSWRADQGFVEPGRSISIRFDRAVVVRRIETQGMACEVVGALVCEIAELTPGQVAVLAVHLGVAGDAVLAQVEDDSRVDGASKRLLMLDAR
jgi:parallel beta-helix repeat protein